jgi:hypothetical protein
VVPPPGSSVMVPQPCTGVLGAGDLSAVLGGSGRRDPAHPGRARRCPVRRPTPFLWTEQE